MSNHPPKCGLAPCLEPAMINCPDCWYHWQTTRGWDEATGEYLPFAAPVEDADYAGAEMYTKPPKKKKRTAA